VIICIFMGRHVEACNLARGLLIWLPAEIKPPVVIHVISNVQINEAE
jgi:hypothetical protein